MSVQPTKQQVRPTRGFRSRLPLTNTMRLEARTNYHPSPTLGFTGSEDLKSVTILDGSGKGESRAKCFTAVAPYQVPPVYLPSASAVRR